MSGTEATRERGGPRPCAGFSVVEVMVAAAILFVVAIGLIPLFSRALISNRSGADATTVSHFGLSQVEAFSQPRFDSDIMDPAVIEDYYSRQDKVWRAGPPPSADPALWTRTTTITQHNLADLLDDGVFDRPEPDDTDASFLHLKLVHVEVAMERDPANPLGRRRNLQLRTVRPF